MIVSNGSNGVDIDRADYRTFIGVFIYFITKSRVFFLILNALYLQRDAVMCGVDNSSKTTIDRYIEKSRIKLDPVTNRPIIAVPEQLLTGLFDDFFRTRLEMFKKVYLHKTVKRIEVMQKDMLKLAQDIFKDTVGSHYPQLRHMHLDMQFYSKLGEDMIDGLIESTEFKPELVEKYEKARMIRNRISRRQLYPELAKSRALSSNWKLGTGLTGTTKRHEEFIELLVAEIPNEEFRNLVNDGMFELFRFKFHYGAGEENPMKNFRYFINGNEQVHQVSVDFQEFEPTAMPEVFQFVSFTKC